MGGANPRASVLMPPSSIFTVPKRAAPPVREPLPVAARWARLGGRSPLRRTIPLARPQRPPPSAIRPAAGTLGLLGSQAGGRGRPRPFG